MITQNYKNRHKTFSLVGDDMTLQMTVKLTETALLPGDIQDYSARIQSWWESLRPRIAAKLREFGEDEGMLGLLDAVVDKLVASAHTFQVYLN